jgi:hypothetical protein
MIGGLKIYREVNKLVTPQTQGLIGGKIDYITPPGKLK